MMPFCNPMKINLFDNPAAIKSKTFFEKKWNICFDENVSNAFFAKICSALTKNMNRDLHSVHWEKVTKVPFTFMTEFPLKKWPKFRSWTWTERELNGKSSVPTMLCQWERCIVSAELLYEWTEHGGRLRRKWLRLS